jgi:hypothetical protein
VKATLLLALLTGCLASAAQEKDGPVYTDTFLVDEKDLATTGRNPYFILEPGYQLYFESPDKKETLTISTKRRRWRASRRASSRSARSRTAR